MMEKDLRNPEYYINRELSWMQFNGRVLSEATDPENPLFERFKFLGISASNLDEFFMVRVASIKDMIHAEIKKRDIAGMTPKEQLAELNRVTHEFVDRQYRIFDDLREELKRQGLVLIVSHEDLSKKQKAFVDEYFHDNVYPVLTPMAVDSSRPFPLVRNKTLNIGAMLRRKSDGSSKALISGRFEGTEDEIDFALVQVPDVLERVVELPGDDTGDGTRYLILLEEIIERNIEKLFLNYDVICFHPFRVMRNADFEIDEDEAEDLLEEIEKQLKKRQWGMAIRLEIQHDMDYRLKMILQEELNISDEDIYEISGPLDLTVMSKITKVEGYDELRQPSYIPQRPKMFTSDKDIFTQIREGDKILMLPYESFEPVVDFISQAARDPRTLAIKMTLYRVSGNSPILAALAQAAENGKQVSVLVELKARFDEENNIVWARRLEKAGCHVIYGLLGLKTHSKIALVVRREKDGIRRYVHLGTGNYNDVTARLYTDVGLFTCSPLIGEDATAVFNMLSGYSEPAVWNKLSLAPLWLKDRFLELIHRERDAARSGKEGRIIAKMNSVCDPDIIAALYEASCAGVKIQMIVRGICCLRPGIPGVSENISVRSIVGQFLEHSRIIYFLNGGKEEVYMGSADWMPRNLEKRVEILFPVEDKEIRQELKGYLMLQLSDNKKARIMNSDGTYEKKDVSSLSKKKLISSQEECCKISIEEAKRREKNMMQVRRFVPEHKHKKRKK